MRQHLSVLMLAARSTIYKVLGLFVLTALAESALFYFNLQKTLAGEPLGLEQLISESRIALVCGASFLLLCALLSLTGCEMGGSKLRYTLQRLSVGEETIVLWWELYNAICFFLFWALHVVIVLLLSRLYVARMDAAYVTDQTIPQPSTETTGCTVCCHWQKPADMCVTLVSCLVLASVPPVSRISRGVAKERPP